MKRRMVSWALGWALGVAGLAWGADGHPGVGLPDSLVRPRWRTGSPVLTARSVDGEDWVSVKDPSIVRAGDRWHLFVTVRGTRRSHAIMHVAFRDWADAERAPRRILNCHAGYFCAPQVFRFRPQRKWYLICQAADEGWNPRYQPAFATTEDLASPDSWTPLSPMWPEAATAPKAWLDFWVICDERRAHLFFTSLDGNLWRSETDLERFPGGWSAPVKALSGDIFEASHTYRWRGLDRYLTIVEAQNGAGWRYYKSYLAERLEGPWQPLGAERGKAFASMQNVVQTAERWTDSVSHGELLRASEDERLEVDAGDLRFLVQGVLDRDRAGCDYGRIPWRLGLLEPER